MFCLGPKSMQNNSPIPLTPAQKANILHTDGVQMLVFVNRSCRSRRLINSCKAAASGTGAAIFGSKRISYRHLELLCRDLKHRPLFWSWCTMLYLLGLYEFRLRGPYQGTMGSTLDLGLAPRVCDFKILAAAPQQTCSTYTTPLNMPIAPWSTTARTESTCGLPTAYT